jgi:hypothetical protein
MLWQKRIRDATKKLLRTMSSLTSMRMMVEEKRRNQRRTKILTSPNGTNQLSSFIQMLFEMK